MIRISKFLIFIALAGFIALGCVSEEGKKLAHVEKARQHLANGGYKNARLELENAVQIDPGYVEAHRLLGETHLKLGRPQEAFHAYTRVEKLAPENIEAQLRLATLLPAGQKAGRS